MSETENFWDNNSANITTEELSDEDLKMVDETNELDDNQVENLLSEVPTNIFGSKLDENNDQETYTVLTNKVFSSSIRERSAAMKELYKTAMEDETLSEENKKIVKGMTMAYNCAIFADKVSAPMLSFFMKHNNLKKHMSDVRYSRILDNLRYVIDKSGFNFRPEAIGLCAKVLLMKYGFTFEKEENNRFSFYPSILISLYSKGLNVGDYANLWYIIVFITNLYQMSIIEFDGELESLNDQDKELYELRQRLAKFLVYMWKKADPEGYSDPKTEEEAIAYQKSLEENSEESNDDDEVKPMEEKETPTPEF